MKYKWLLFDADGTLFDYDNAELFALRNTFSFFNISFSKEHHRIYKKINKNLFRKLEKEEITSRELRTERFDILFSEFNIKADVEAFSQKYLSRLSDYSELIPGAFDAIHALFPAYKMLIITNGISDVQRPRLEQSDINKYFIDIVISDEIGIAKPAEEFFDYVFDVMGDPEKKEVLIIGDSLTSDIAGGINYGIDTCWFNPGKARDGDNLKPTYEINRLQQLLEIVT